MKYKFFLSAFSLLSALLVENANASIRINEVLASNNSVNVDPDYGDNADWVEIYNDGDEAVDLSGYYLTDNLSTPDKFTFPTGTKIDSKGYMLVWCDGNDNEMHTSFKLSADGEQVGLYSPELELIDSVSFGAQYINVSYGRTLSNANEFRFFTKPTPLAANTGKGYVGKANQPMILTMGGKYSGSVDVVITNDLGGEVRYTLDGTEPTDTSSLYTAPIKLTKTAVVRARIFDGEKMPGNVMTSSYFINDEFEGHNLPIVSIATDPRNFWDSTVGIYTQDFKPDWEVPVNIEMFENNGSDRAAFNSPAGVKINGLAAWQLPQKMLGVYFKKKYGESKLEYQLFHDDPRNSFNNFALRASGNDWSNTLFKDGMIQQACRKAGVQYGLMAFRPSMVYVNGEFLGIHNIREKVDADYITQHYGYKSKDFDMVENGYIVENGSIDAWKEFEKLSSADLSVQANYEKLAEVLDVEGFTDYVIAEIYCANASIDHNLMAWKPKEEGKWKWILMDMDRGFFSVGLYTFDYFVGQKGWPLKNMMANKDYKQYFAQRCADRLFASYNSVDIDKQIYQHRANIEPVMDQQIARWKGTTSDWGDALPDKEAWDNYIGRLINYSDGRPKILLSELSGLCGIGEPHILSLRSSESALNSWTFNGLKVDMTNIGGLYPEGLKVSVSANFKDGYSFKGWRRDSVENVIEKGSTWKYLEGKDLGETWIAEDFDDSEWKERSIAENVSSETNTYYFRRHISLDSVTARKMLGAKINLMQQGGAVVYVNGQKVISTNMHLNSSFNSRPNQTPDSTARVTYIPFELTPSAFKVGDNVITVEVHHLKNSNYDKVMDLELFVELAGDEIVETSPTLEFVMGGETGYTALFEKTSDCVVPSTITEDLTLSKDCSPYLVPEDVKVAEGVTLTIEPGVILNVSPNVNFLVNGSVIAEGTADDSIKFQLNPKYDSNTESWGAINFIHTGDMVSKFKYTEVKNASKGPKAFNCVAAISGFDTHLLLDHINITNTNANPVALRYGSVVLSNSTLHSEITGDLINVKYAKGRVEGNMFIGNDQPDSDAIDYDGVDGGIIRNNVIRDFIGYNSDGIDLGEQAHNVYVDSILVFNITDKGISVGQRSNVILTNSTFIQTNLGVGIKDSCGIDVDHCTFYGVATPISCYEKVFGRGGGNAVVKNSVLSNSYDQAVFCDAMSSVKLINNICDTDTLPEADGNVFDSPEFVAAGEFNILTPNDVYGSDFLPIHPEEEPIISEICYAPIDSLGQTEYIKLFNPNDEPLNISGYVIDKGITFTFPEGATIEPDSCVYVAKSAEAMSGKANVYEWTKGSLANEGETIRITRPNGVVIDMVTYSPAAPWPVVKGTSNILVLTDLLSTNNWAQHWSLKDSNAGVETLQAKPSISMVYSKDTKSAIFFSENNDNLNVKVYSVSGICFDSFRAENGQEYLLNRYPSDILLIKVNNELFKVQR